MNTNITGKQFELTESIKTYINQALESLEKYGLDIISSRVVISADEKQGKKGFKVDLSLSIPKKGTVVIGGKNKDLYAAIDDISARAAKVLRRESDKIKTHKNKDELKEQILDITNDIKIDFDEIIPTELEIYKPLEVEEALEILKSEENRLFIVFNDLDAKMRVLYKRKDGNFGLY
ncbi:MAG: ribosome-associated translation inhibitor RaiA [Campylobacter sp.]|nr:ribosome-associated translation inhibitor RaiA [Campylobacter sp.]